MGILRMRKESSVPIDDGEVTCSLNRVMKMNLKTKVQNNLEGLDDVPLAAGGYCSLYSPDGAIQTEFFNILLEVVASVGSDL